MPASDQTHTPSGRIGDVTSDGMETFTLPFDPAHHYPFYEIPLCDEEYDEDRHQHRDARRHQQVILRAVQVLERVEPERERLLLQTLRVDQRAEEIIPVADERQHGDGRERG